jgi:hypothetical protein
VISGELYLSVNTVDHLVRTPAANPASAAAAS